jgi:hypothetical protein
MGRSCLPKPGSLYGPCESQCHHLNCRITRKEANSLCRLCGKPIGYETCFDRDPGDAMAFAHASCLEDIVETRASQA